MPSGKGVYFSGRMFMHLEERWWKDWDQSGVRHWVMRKGMYWMDFPLGREGEEAWDNWWRKVG